MSSSDPIESHRPRVPRVYNALLRGKDNYAADRAAAEELARRYPLAETMARENRAFLRRAVRYIADRGCTQYLDIGSGLPMGESIHQIVREVIPTARVLYVDHDSEVLAHARALLATSDGVDVLAGDMREPEALGRAASEILDLAEPVALIFGSVLHFVPDDGAASTIVRVLCDRLSQGSYLIISHGVFRPGLDDETAAFCDATVHPVARRDLGAIADLIPPDWSLLHPLAALPDCIPDLHRAPGPFPREGEAPSPPDPLPFAGAIAVRAG